ncbi:MAG TPA: TadE/TadG family type IV pilus assembly protein [Sphingomicrobium sp.]|nr:TadE/TadG family type IV pilus assembly protein [Sphingomicrobium sp.]
MMINKLRMLAADDRGTSLVEMALATPFLAATLMGMVDLSRAYSDKLRLEQAAQVAIERVMNRQMSSTSYNTLKAEAASSAGVAESNVTIDFWLQCNGTRQTDYDTSCTTGQVSARYLTVEVQKDFMPMFGTKYFPGANSDGTYTIRSEAGIRTQ